VPVGLWVVRLHISAATARKISGRHGLSSQEVQDAVELRAGLRYVWHEDPTRGRRALVECYIRRQRIVAVLYPADSPMGDEYNLGSAYPERP
jgi:hypothetical protein